MPEIKTTWDEVSLEAMLLRNKQEIEQRRRERVLKGELRRPVNSLQMEGRKQAALYAESKDVDELIALVKEAREELEKPFAFSEPEGAEEKRREYQRGRMVVFGILEGLEAFLREQDVYVPTKEEEQKIRIEKMLIMEGVA